MMGYYDPVAMVASTHASAYGYGEQNLSHFRTSQTLICASKLSLALFLVATSSRTFRERYALFLVNLERHLTRF